MNPTVKVAGFAAALAVTFGASFGIAQVAAPGSLARDGVAAGHGGGHATETTAAAPVLHGFESASDGFRLIPESSTLAAGGAVPFRFRVTRDDGRTPTSYRPLRERDLHLIVVRRDLTGFQHVHPTRGADGTWSTELQLPGGGTWRAFTDLSPVGGPDQLTLGTDLQVAGPFEPGTLPAVATPTTDTVSFDRAGDRITAKVSRAGSPVAPDPYLGARGHLVVIRAGDLGYAHVHPEETAGPDVAFDAQLPAGAYSLFLDYVSDGGVTTATSTLEVQ